MEVLNNTLLIETYKKAIECKVDPYFINMLEEEIKKRAKLGLLNYSNEMFGFV